MRRLLGLLAFLAVVPAAQATTLVNDPARPLSTRDFARAQRWVNESAVPTAPGSYVITRGLPDDGAEAGAAGDHHIWLGAFSRDALMHEMGHEAQFFLQTDEQRFEIQHLLGMDGQPWQAAGPSPMEVAADAYAECSMHATWPGRWWVKLIRRHGRVVGATLTPTSYDFRAGPKRFAAICGVYGAT